MPGAPRLALFIAIAALALAGCGDDDDSGSGSGASDGGGGASSEESADTTETTTAESGPNDVVATIEVEETEYELNPANPGVQKAGKVAFEVTNAGKIGHALEVEGPKGEAKTKEIAPGDTATFTADLGKPGKYKWYCPIADHEQQGMTGSIVVGDAGTDQPSKKGEAGPGSDGHDGY